MVSMNEKARHRDGPLSTSETETKTSATGPVAQGRSGWGYYFEKLPREAAEALRRGELSFKSHGLLTYIIGSIDWKRGDYARKLTALMEDVDWEWTDQHLRNELADLKSAGWIDFESKQGQRSPYCFRLGRRILEALTSGGLPAPLPTDFQPGTPSQFEVTSNDLSAIDAALADPKPDSPSPELQTDSPPKTETKTETQTSITEGRTTKNALEEAGSRE
jgi:hypothetical protein